MASKTVNRTLKININGKEIELSITNLNKQIRQLKKNLAGTTDPAKRKKYNDELNKTYAARRKINDELRGTQGLLGKVRKQLGPIGTAMIAAFSVQAVMSFAGQVIDTIKLFHELKHETKLLTGLQGVMLDEAVSGTKALADTFNTDYKENLQAANTLSKQFGVTYDEALQAMEKGYLAGANVSGDMLNQLKEYAPLMDEANVSLEEMVALIAQTEKAGIFNDKGIDAIKEGMLKIREGTDSTKDAMTALGIDTKQVYKDLAEGNTGYLEVMQLVSTKLNEVEEQSPAVGQAIADIFGGPGEDAGLQYLQSIKDIDLELGNLIDTTDEYTLIKQREIDVNERLNETWVELSSAGGLFNNIAVTAKGYLVDILGAFRDLDVMLANAEEKHRLQNLSDEEEQFRAHMERMKKALGDRYDYEQLRSNYAANISDENIKKQVLGFEELVSKEKIATNAKAAEEKKAAEAKEEREKNAEQKKEERDTAKQEKRLEKLRESEEEYEALQRQLKEESDQRTFDLEEENRLEEEAQRLEQEILNAETDEERTRLIIERAQYIAIEELRIQQRKDIERAKLAKATEEEIFAIKQKYILAEQKINVQHQKGVKDLKIQEVQWEDMTQNQKLDLVRMGLSQAAELFNKNTAAYKAIKITETLIATYQAAMNSYNSLSVIPIVGPALGGIAAAAAVVAGLKQVQNIRSTETKRMPRYDQGGPTSSLGFSDGSGHDVAGVVHADEYVIPKFVLQDATDPVVPAVVQYLEAKRTGQSFVDGGATTIDAVPASGDLSSINVAGANDIQMEVMMQILYRLNNPLPGIAFLDNEEAQKINNYLNEVEQARNGAIIR